VVGDWFQESGGYPSDPGIRLGDAHYRVSLARCYAEGIAFQASGRLQRHGGIPSWDCASLGDVVLCLDAYSMPEGELGPRIGEGGCG
jgi:hypothetical protein